MEQRFLPLVSDTTARIWEAETGKEMVKFAGHTGDVLQATWSQDEANVLTASSDGTAIIWDAAKGNELIRLEGHTGGVLQASWSGDGEPAFTASRDSRARIWDLSRNDGLVKLESHKRIVWQATWNHNETKSFAAHLPAMTVLPASGMLPLAPSWSACKGAQALPIKQLGTKTDRRYLPSTTTQIRIWDAASGTKLVSLQEGHRFC